MSSIKYIFILLLLVSCKKDKTEPDSSLPKTFGNGVLVLNEGLFQQNNSTLSWIDLNTNEVEQNVFLNINDRLLGDTGNDLQRYGGKIYIVINASSTVEVVDALTLKSIKQISLNHEGQGQEPRRIDFWKNRAYVSSYDGFVNIIDTSSLNIIERIEVGRNPEGLVVLNDRLYVANSGGLSFPDVDSTVFEIDLTTNMIQDTFVVGNNPGDLISDGNEHIYAVKRGDYDTDPSELIKINLSTKTVENTSIPTSSFSKKGNDLYLSYYDYNTESSNVSYFDLSSQQLINSNLIDNSNINTLYGAYYYTSNQIMCLDAMNFTNTGFVKLFDDSGNLSNTYEVGLNPNKILIYD